MPFLKYTRAAARRARGEWEAAQAVDRLLFESTCSVNDLLAAFRTERAAKWLSVGSSLLSSPPEDTRLLLNELLLLPLMLPRSTLMCSIAINMN